MIIHIHTHTHTYIHTCIHTYIHTYTHTHTYIHTHTRIHTYIHTHTHIHTYIHNSFSNVILLQLNLRIKDILGPVILSTIERLSSSWRYIIAIGDGTSSQRVLYQRFHCIHYSMIHSRPTKQLLLFSLTNANEFKGMTITLYTLYNAHHLLYGLLAMSRKKRTES